MYNQRLCINKLSLVLFIYLNQFFFSFSGSVQLLQQHEQGARLPVKKQHLRPVTPKLRYPLWYLKQERAVSFDVPSNTVKTSQNIWLIVLFIYFIQS